MSAPVAVATLPARALLLPTSTGAPAQTEVVTWGEGGFLGVLMRGPDDAEPLPPRAVLRLARRGVVDAACGAMGTAVLTEQGELLVSGFNDDGQLVPHSASSTVAAEDADDEAASSEVIFKPRVVQQLVTQRVVQVALGERHAALVNDTFVSLAFGVSDTGALGSGAPPTPQGQPPSLTRGLGACKVVQVACGNAHSLFLTRDGSVFVCGSGLRGALGLGSKADRPEATRLRKLAGVPVAHVACGDDFSLCVSASGLAFAWGSNKHGQLGASCVLEPERPSPARVLGLPELVRLVAAGGAHSAWVSRSGRLYMSGRNERGQLGLGPPRAEATRTRAPLSGSLSSSSSSLAYPRDKLTTTAAAAAAAVDSDDMPLLLPASHSASEGNRVAEAYDDDDEIPGLDGADVSDDDDNDDDEGGLPALDGAPTTSRHAHRPAGARAQGQVAPPPLPPRDVVDAPTLVTRLLLGAGDASAAGGEVRLDLLHVRDVALGRRHSLVLLVDGRVLGMGDCGEGAAGFAQGLALAEAPAPATAGSAAAAAPAGAPAAKATAYGDAAAINAQWWPRMIPELSGTGVFRVVAGGGHNVALRVTQGSVLARLPGLLPPGTMRFSDAALCAGAIAAAASTSASAAASSVSTPLAAPALASVKALVHDVFGSASTLSGSFVAPPIAALVVETRAAEPSCASAGVRASTSAGVSESSSADEVAASAGASAPPALTPLRLPSTSAEGVAEPSTPSVATPWSAPAAPLTPAGVPHTPLGLSPDLPVVLAPAAAGALVPVSAALERSGLDVEGLQQTYGGLLRTKSPEVMLELVHALSLVVGELEGATAMLVGPDPLRALLGAWLAAPAFSQPSLAPAALTLARLLSVILALPQESRDQLMRWVARDVPPRIFLEALVRPLQKHISANFRFLLAQRGTEMLPGADQLAAAASPFRRPRLTHSMAFQLSVRVLRLLFIAHTSAVAAAAAGAGAGTGAEDAVLTAAAFVNADVSAMPEMLLSHDYNIWHAGRFRRSARPESFAVLGYPFLLSPAFKKRVVAASAQSQMQAEGQQALMRSVMQGGGLGVLFGGAIDVSDMHLTLSVRRAHLLSDTLQQLNHASPRDLFKQLKVTFVGEEGIDQGGVTKELFALLVREVFDSKYGLWAINTDSHTAWPHPATGAEAASEFRLLGIVLGLAVYNGILLDVHFPLVCYKKLLGTETAGLGDLRSVNPALAAGLQKLLDYTPAVDVEEVFCLSFEASYEAFGEPETVELEPGGRERAVTGANRAEYVALYCDWVLNKSVQGPFNEFRGGLEQLLPEHLRDLFQPEELELLVCGSQLLDFRELERVAQYEGGFSREHATVRLFWRVVHSMSEELKKKLLLFVTGSARAPIGGLGNLPFKLQRHGTDSLLLPQASTCFNLLLLPPYSTEERLRDRLTRALEECEGFGNR